MAYSDIISCLFVGLEAVLIVRCPIVGPEKNVYIKEMWWRLCRVTLL